MIRISKPLRSHQVVQYFEKEYANAAQKAYYHDGSEGRGWWHGRLAAEWGLVGAVQKEHFARLSEGLHPHTGEELLRRRPLAGKKQDVQGDGPGDWEKSEDAWHAKLESLYLDAMAADRSWFPEKTEFSSPTIAEGVARKAPERAIAPDEWRDSLVQMHRDAARIYQTNLEHPHLGAAARRYLDSRKISSDSIRGFELGSSYSRQQLVKALAHYGPERMEASGLFVKDKAGRFHDRFADRIIFPIHNRQGEIIALSGRALHENERTPKYLNSPATELYNKSEELYNAHRLQRGKPVTLVEGYFDVIAAHEAGLNSAAISGTALSEKQIRSLETMTASVVLAFDSDTPGEKATAKHIQTLAHSRLQTSVARALPDDPAKTVEMLGPQPLRDAVQHSYSLTEWAMTRIPQRFDLKTAEGQIDAVHEVTRVLAQAHPKHRAEIEKQMRAALDLPDAPAEKQKREVNPKARYAWEIAVAPPKSISEAICVAGNKELLEDVRASLKVALDSYQDITQARMGGNKAPQTTKNWAVAVFEHDVSRPVRDELPMPQIHHHCIDFNVTRCGDKKYRSQDPHELFREQSCTTAIYRAELAYRAIHDRGYEIVRAKEGGKSFELKGYTPEYLKALSPRREQIKAQMEVEHVTGAAAAERIAKETRGAKFDVDPVVLKQHHRAVAAEYGYQGDRALELARARLVEQNVQKAKELREGDPVVWMHRAHDSYGYVIPVPARIVKFTGDGRANISGELKDGGAKLVSVPLTHLRTANPEPLIPKDHVRLYRGRAEACAPETIPEWKRESPEYRKIQEAQGRWFTADRKIAQDWYVRDAGPTGHLVYVDVPRADIEQYRVSAQPREVSRFSRDPENEFFLPRELATKAAPLGYDRKKEALAAVDAAVDSLQHKKSVFDRYEIVRDALISKLGQIRLSDVLPAIDQRVREGQTLVEVTHYRNHAPGVRYSTYEEQRKERTVLDIATKTRCQVQPIAPHVSLTGHAQLAGNDARRRILEDILQTTDQYVLLQGAAGARKTTSMTILRPVAEQAGYEVRAYAPTGGAAKELRNRGLPAETLQSLLARGPQNAKTNVDHPKRPVFWIIDEMSQVSTRQAYDFMTRHVGPRDHVLFVGDDDPTRKVGQHKSVEAGRVFHMLQDAGVKTARLNRMYRQEDPLLAEVARNVRDGQMEVALDKLVADGRVREIESAPLRHYALARDYAESPDKTFGASAANESVRELNNVIRMAMKTYGHLSTTGEQKKVLVARQDVTPEELRHAWGYEVGDVVRFAKSNKGVGVSAREYVTVESVDEERNVLGVRRQNGETFSYSPRQVQGGCSTYREETREFAVGDRLQFTLADPQLRVANRDTSTIRELLPEQNAIRVELDAGEGEEKGRRVTVNLSDHRHLEYAYAMTTYSLQSKSVNRLLLEAAVVDNPLAHQFNQDGTYVALTRPKYDLKIYTDDVSEMKQALAQQVVRPTALAPKVIQSYRRDRQVELTPDL